MEEANQSDKHLKLLNDIHTRVSFFEDQIDAVREQIEALEQKLQKIFWFIEFHLGEIPIKYRKAFPKEGEYPYIKIDKHEIDPTTSKVYPSDSCLMPKDPSELAKS